MINVTQMTLAEIKSTMILSLIFASRMLGLFMVLPVLALYQGKISQATPTLIGLAAGIYGFSQALLQLPYGILSDYLGRRLVIAGGLGIFALGSLIAAFSDSIWGLILGRAIQGAGAIGSPLLALVADVTRDQVRTRAMALMGMTIGITFVLALLLGPLLEAYVGLKGIFLFTALMAGSGILLLLLIQQRPLAHGERPRRSWRGIWQQKDLWYLNINIFVLHAVLTATFLILPAKVQALSAWSGPEVWRFYLPTLGIGTLLMMPLLRHADGERQQKLLKLALVVLGLSTLLLFNTQGFSVFMLAAILFFAAFNFLEASFPALVSRIVPVTQKGAALGLYSCSQFLGMFMGGLLGGALQQWLGAGAVGIGCLVLLSIGFLALQPLQYFNSFAKEPSRKRHLNSSPTPEMNVTQ